MFLYEVPGDMTAEELTRALYPNLVANPGPELNGMDQTSLVGWIGERIQVGIHRLVTVGVWVVRKGWPLFPTVSSLILCSL